ncbi:MAG: hypothetical protein U1D30_25270 [Planctomycetota bacterium]
MKRSLFPAFSYALLSLAGLTWGTPSKAAFVIYSGYDDPRGTLANSTAAFNAFTATLSDYGVDTLESYGHLSPDPTLSFGSTGITAQTDFNFVASISLYAVSGSKILYDAGPGSPGGAAVDDTFTFNTPITAFGTYISNAGSDAQANTITFIFENTVLGTSKSFSLPPLGPNRSGTNALFFGVTDTDPFDKITVRESFDYDGILLDNITAGYVAVVPEASSLAMISTLVGLAGIVAWRRKDRTT